MTSIFETAKAGDPVYLPGEVRPYRVKCRDERFVICTKPFNLDHTVMYFIVDLKEKRRGPDNSVFCAGYETQEQCDERPKELQTGWIEVSHRYDVPLDIWRKVTKMRPDIRDRIARHAEDNRERDLKEHERVRRAVEHRRTREEFLKWKEEMGFDMYLTASQILMILTCQRDMNEPKHPEDEWSEEFRTAIELIPEALRFYNDMAMECTEVKNDVMR